VTTPGLWEKLQSGIPPTYDIAKQDGVMEGIYAELLVHSGSKAEVLA
jgi:hypothetical protein